MAVRQRRGAAETIVNPATGERIASVPETSLSQVEEAVAAADAAFPQWAQDHAAGAVAEAAAGRRPAREAGRGVRQPGVGQYRQTAGPALGDELPAIVDCFRFFAGAALRAGGRGRGVSARPDQHDPARPGGRGGAGGALELPADDGGLEAGAGAGRGQYGGAQALGTDAAHHAQARRVPGCDLSDRRGQHRHRPGRHRRRTFGEP